MSTILLIDHDARSNTQTCFRALNKDHFVISVPDIFEAVAYLRIMMVDIIIVQIPLLAADFRELVNAFIYGKSIS